MAITVRPTGALARPRRRSVSRQTLEGYACILPWLLGFSCFVAGPMVAALLISLTDWSMLAPPIFVGLDNYTRMLADPLFYTVLVNTAYISFLAVPLHLIVALAIALGLNEKIRGVNFYRTIFYLPSQMPIVASALLWLWVFNPDFGLANALLNVMNLP